MLYINKSARTPFWAMEYSRDEGLRKYWDEFSPPFHKDGQGPLYRGAPAAEYNRNQDSHAIENVDRWFDYWRERPGTGTRVSSGGVNIIFSDSNTHFRGAELHPDCPTKLPSRSKPRFMRARGAANCPSHSVECPFRGLSFHGK